MIIKLSDYKKPIRPIEDFKPDESVCWQDWFHVKPSIYHVYYSGKPLPKVAILEVVK